MQRKKESFFILDYGCSERKVDSKTLSTHLIKNGHFKTDKVKDADIILVSTCAHVNFNEKKSIKNIERINNIRKKNSKLIVTGCLPIINPKKLKEIFNGPTIHPLKLDEVNNILKLKKKEVIEENNIISPSFSFQKIKTFLDINSPFAVFEIFPQLPEIIRYASSKLGNKITKKKAKGNQKKYYIVTGTGCSYSCSYCAIKRVHGNTKSRTIKEINAKFKKGIEKGYTEFYLLHKDIASYGRDIHTSLTNLLFTIFKYKGDYTIGFTSSFSPKELLKNRNELIKLLKENPNKVLEIEISIQSGSKEVLKKMKRANYSLEELKDFILYFKNELPNINLSGSIMIGFPTEEDKDFDKTIEFIRKADLKDIRVWIYNEKPNTTSTLLFPKVSWRVIRERIKKLKKEMKKEKRKLTIINYSNRFGL